MAQIAPDYSLGDRPTLPGFCDGKINVDKLENNMLNLIILFVAFACMLFREIYLFNKGRYIPYLFNNNLSFKQRIMNVGWFIVSWWSLHNAKPSTDVLKLLLIALSLCVSILNYLSYRKIKDRKIIYQTIILDIFVMALFLL